MRVSELFAETKALTVPVGEGEIKLSYRPQAVTPEMIDRMTNAGNVPGDAIVATVVDLVAAWDLQGDDEAAYPLTVKDVRRLPITFLATLTKAITEDINPNAVRRNN